MNLITDPYVGLYFYSAVFQGNMALLALLGVFAIFRIQVIENRLSNLEAQLSQFIKDYIDRLMRGSDEHLDFTDMNKLRESVEKLPEKFDQQPYISFAISLTKLPFYINGFAERKALFDKISTVTKHIKTPLFLTLFVIVLSLILLPLAYSINTRFIHPVEECAILVMILINIFTLISSIKFIFSLLKN